MRKIIVAGSRTVNDPRKFSGFLDRNIPQYCEIVHGGANGVDQIAENYAQEAGVPVTVFDPKKPEETETEYSAEEYGKGAFIKRNREMAEYADELIAIWNGESSGTRDMIDTALDRGLDVSVKVIDDDRSLMDF